jgi:uncharacterized coiled-coil DUF342 family protein
VTDAQLQQIITELKACREDIAALRKRIDELHDPVLQAYLEQAIQIKPAPPSLEDMVKQAKKKTS